MKGKYVFSPKKGPFGSTTTFAAEAKRRYPRSNRKMREREKTENKSSNAIAAQAARGCSWPCWRQHVVKSNPAQNRPNSKHQDEIVSPRFNDAVSAYSGCLSQPMRPRSSLRSLCPGRLTPELLACRLMPDRRSQLLKSSASTPTSSSRASS